MLLSRTIRLVIGLGLCACGLLFAASAAALPQWSPTTGTERAHTVASGEEGIEWDTTKAGAREVAYDSGSGVLTVSGWVDVLNYYDPVNASCLADVGSNCEVGYSPNLDLTVTADLHSIDKVPVFGDFWKVTLNFQTAGGLYDLLATDPADSDSTMLKASFVSGFYDGTPTTGLFAAFDYDAANDAVFGVSVTAPGIFQVDETTLHASLFGDSTDDYLGLGITNVFLWDDGGTPAGEQATLDRIITAAFDTGVLPSFTAEADGQAFRIEAGDFEIPEPSTALLLGFGLSLMEAARRRRR